MSRNAHTNPHTAYRAQEDEPVAFMPVPESHSRGSFVLPEDARERISIDVIHDGNLIPPELLVDANGTPIPDEAFWDDYVRERDWGAAAVAAELARQLGLAGYLNVQIARVVMDFGRFPGITIKGAGHLDRHAINYPFSTFLGFDQKRRVLEHYYDAISARFNAIVAPVQVKIAIHTYDTFNDSGTRRPPMSILTRCVGYQISSEMPFGVFDPLYPDILGEFTSDRILRDRLSLTLERAGMHTEHNYPYLLPDGSVEVRSQVWSFFRFTRETFEQERPETRDDPTYHEVWDMLLDTNLRSSVSEMLRGYLHAFRRVQPEREAEFAAARQAYDEIADFIRRDDNKFVERYRQARMRPSAIGIEIRKDLVHDFDADGQPTAPRLQDAHDIARILARAIYIYFTEDYPDSHAVI